MRTRVEEVSVQGRNTQGVRVIRTRDGEALVSVGRIAEDDIETDVAADLDGGDSAPIPDDDITNEGDEGADG